MRVGGEAHNTKWRIKSGTWGFSKRYGPFTGGDVVTLGRDVWQPQREAGQETQTEVRKDGADTGR